MSGPRLSPASAECRRKPRRSPEVVKRDGWREDGILVVDVNDPGLTWPERALIRNLGNRLYGRGKFSAATVVG